MAKKNSLQLIANEHNKRMSCFVWHINEYDFEKGNQ